MTLDQLVQLASLFMAIGISIGWLLATSRRSFLRSLDRLLPPRYLKTAGLRRRSTQAEGPGVSHEQP